MKGKYLLPLILALLLGLVVPAAAVSIPGPGTGPVSAKVEVTPATVYSGDTVTAKVTLTNPPIFAVTYAYAWHLPSGTFSNESESPSDSFSVLSVGEASVTVSVYNKLTKGLITTSNVATFTVLPDLLEGFTYEEHVAGSMRIKAYTGSAAEVQVPSHIKSLPVTMIGAQAFAKRLGITKVVLPSTIETIEYNAFDGCSLQSINLPEGLRTIENGVFYRCPQLRSITLPASLKAVSPFAFSECESLSSVTLPEGLLTISSDAFSGCPSLAYISLPSTLTAIGTSAFSGCKALSAITIPDKVSLLEDFTFLGCSSLSQVRLPATLKGIGVSAFRDCVALTAITIPDGVSKLENNTFLGCSALSQITLPAGLTSIGSGTFSGCRSLSSLPLPDSVSQLGEGAFMGCSGLTQFELPAKLILIPAQAFKGCAKLSSIKVPSGVKEIGIEAFMDCLALRQATIRANVGKIGSDAFRNDPVTIYGDVPSVAQVYAGSVGIPFVDLAAMPGDADANRKLDELDALRLIAFLVDGTHCNSMKNADTNGSGGHPDIADLAALIDLLLAK